ncbi:hypothetical protein [Mesorhizobium australicum]|uniref:hypothetical protein n=1 Tax=Mesorhizobium australicum TaxID=536018 RepID=UPI00111BEA4F|nr:hypothetical protein [Mesorhizobium australicum]
MSSDDPSVPPQSTAEWAKRVSSLADVLRTMSSEAFFDESTLCYHSSLDRFSSLLLTVIPFQKFEDFRPALSRFLDNNPGTKAWLPDTPNRIGEIDLAELYFRLLENWGGERWADGALVEPFENGSLVAALDRLAEEVDRLFLAPR